MLLHPLAPDHRECERDCVAVLCEEEGWEEERDRRREREEEAEGWEEERWRESHCMNPSDSKEVVFPNPENTDSLLTHAKFTELYKEFTELYKEFTELYKEVTSIIKSFSFQLTGWVV